MIEKQIIKQIIIEFQENIPQLSYVHRNTVFDETSNYVLVGLRRAGKSYTIFQHIAERVKNKDCEIADVLYINFEDDRLGDFTMSDFQTILTCYAELYPERKPQIYLDEIQIIDGWEKFARRLADQKYHVFITGSNAKMLSKEIATTLGGRYITRQIHPFSFREYLAYKQIEITDNWQFSGQQLARIKSAFDNYFMYGGFAESFNKDNPREWLSMLLKKILLGDIIVRNNIRDSNNVMLLQRKLAQSVMQPSSINHLCNVLKSTGAKITRSTISDYIGNMKDAFLLFSIENFASSIVERAMSQKNYFSDNGLLSISLFDANTKLLENQVAITLMKRYATDDYNNLYYYNKNVEVDFYIPSESMAIQACYRLQGDSENTLKRELSALSLFADYAKCKKLLVITYDEEDTITYKGKKIEVVPIWKWLLLE